VSPTSARSALWRWPWRLPVRTVQAASSFSLAQTCGPVAWAAGRWPNVDWIDGSLVWVGWEGGRLVWRRVRQRGAALIVVAGSAEESGDAAWADAVLGLAAPCPPLTDAVLERLRARFPGLRTFAAGSLFDGLVSAIVGQSISVAAAAVTERRLAELFHPGLALAGRRFWPLPRPDQLAAADPALLRRSGVTWRRAEALVAVGRAAADGQLPSRDAALADPALVRDLLRSLPLVGPWTVESALLWGVGLADAYPTGDVALLRAARAAYGDPALDRRGLDRLAEGWRPARGWAARLLWTDLLGPAR
jgi:DNA-3-methyladenine glycosylase II